MKNNYLVKYLVLDEIKGASFPEEYYSNYISAYLRFNKIRKRNDVTIVRLIKNNYGNRANNVLKECIKDKEFGYL